MIPP
jgi:hypothetical protein